MKNLPVRAAARKRKTQLVQRCVTVTTRRSIEQWHTYNSSGRDQKQQQKKQQH